MPRIRRLHIEHFRGVPGVLDLDLRPAADSPPASLVLFGENGSGKSSIADAFEFLLRASLSRRLDPERPVKRHAESFAVRDKPYVEGEYSTGELIARGAPRPGSHRFRSGVRKINQPESEFSLAPIVLRRADILGFWSLPDEDRKLVFFDYFRPPSLETAQRVEASITANALEEEIAQLREEKRAAIARLIELTGIYERKIPKTAHRQRAFRKNVLMKRFAVTLGSGKHQRQGLDPEIQRAFNDLVGATQDLDRKERSRRLNVDRAGTTDISRVEAEVQEILEQANELVTESFLEISRASAFLTAVRLRAPADSNELSVRLNLNSGEEVDPLAVLSEANLDLLALLVFCAISEACAAHGQARFLILDDVFQSVDAVYRQEACRYVAERFREWQLVVTTHDRLWFAILSDTFRQAGVPLITREIVRWSFTEGPVIRDAVLEPGAGLKQALDGHDPLLICSRSSLLLEEVSDRLSWTLGTSVTRRPRDRYTLGDSWPGVAKRLGKTNVADAAAKVQGSLVFRNLVGAHFNEWATTVSTAEATRFGEVVLELLYGVRCEECGSWIQGAAGPTSRYSCRCGKVRVEPV